MKMSKYQEAISYLIDKYCDMHFEGKPMNEDTEMALGLQELVNKATPKKLEDKRCPECECLFDLNKYYCGWCGQRIACSDEDE